MAILAFAPTMFFLLGGIGRNREPLTFLFCYFRGAPVVTPVFVGNTQKGRLAADAFF